MIAIFSVKDWQLKGGRTDRDIESQGVLALALAALRTQDIPYLRSL